MTTIIGFIAAFDSTGQLLDQLTGSGMWSAAVRNPHVDPLTRDIAFVTTGGLNSEGIYLDNLRFEGYPVPEPETFAWYCAPCWPRFRSTPHASLSG